jgi:DNA-binding NarL/FixJ family response regulator
MSDLRVVLADNQAVVRAGLKALINAQAGLAVVGEAADVRAAVELVERVRPDVAVLDVTMPDMIDGQAAQRLRRKTPDVKLVALTVCEDRSYLRRLLTLGAAAYVLKRSAGEELIRAIRTVAVGGVYLDPSLAGKVIEGFVRRADGAGAADELSDRESAVVRLTAEGHSTKEIAAKLDVSIKTVETYNARAMDKLGLKSRAALVRYAVACGWLQGL